MSRRTLAILAVIVLAIGVVAFSSLYTVHQTRQALVLQFGEPKRVVTVPGMHAKIPFIQEVIYIDRRILAYDAPAEEVIASDQKRLVVDAYLRYRILDPLRFFQTMQTEERGRQRLNTILTSSLRQVLGSVPLATLLTIERSKLMREATARTDELARDFGITVVDVRVKRADLPEANSQAIYARMKTEREREAREFRAQGAEISQRIRSRADREKTVLIAEAQKRAQITRGEGDGKAVKIFADAFGKDPDFFNFYRTMEAYRESLSGEDTTLVLSPDSEFFSFFRSLSGKLGSVPQAQ
ncbi:MAG: protease modulator HflC [Alphaproteobacteria bacterium]|jgi:membrane protease subunit HflC|nr:protease modulator HflC [Alphaproteobacteria bacterium]MDP6622651.1 protease modulator HflC [Alphaproteobacteria bacterium]|tara:strand:+ start:1055 stop:1948 length:894 start_codon:yes stop_codon:yes gene_type:complete